MESRVMWMDKLAYRPEPCHTMNYFIWPVYTHGFRAKSSSTQNLLPLVMGMLGAGYQKQLEKYAGAGLYSPQTHAQDLGMTTDSGTRDGP